MAESDKGNSQLGPSPEYLTELMSRGDEIYRHMRSELENSHPGKFIAIHVDSADYEIGKTSGEAGRALLERHPIDGRIHIRRIGMDPDYALAARLGLDESPPPPLNVR